MASTKALNLPNESGAPEAVQADPDLQQQARSKVEGALETSYIDRVKDLNLKKDKKEIKEIALEAFKKAQTTEELNAIMQEFVDAGLVTMKGKRYENGPITDAYVDAKSLMRRVKKLAEGKSENANADTTPAEAKPKPTKAEEKPAPDTDSGAKAPKLVAAPDEKAPEVDEKSAAFIERLQKVESKPELYDIMNEAVEAGLITKEEVPNTRNPKGRPFTYYRPDEHPLVQEMQRLTKEFNKQRRAANNKPEKEVVLQEVKNPMAITMEDGKTFPNREKFQRFIDNRMKKAETDEQKAELEAYKKSYVELLDERISELKKLANKVRNQAITAIKIVRNPKNPDGKPGVKDYMQSLFDEGLVFVEKGKLTMPEGVPFAETAIEAANERIDDLLIVKDIQRDKKINGFEVNEKNCRFVFQINTSIDDLTGKKKVRVKNVISIYGKPTVKEGEYVIGIDAPNAVVLATKEFEKRLAKREKARAKKEEASIKTVSEKAEAPAAESSDSEQAEAPQEAVK